MLKAKEPFVSDISEKEDDYAHKDDGRIDRGTD